jgi:hypothetical protein
MCYIEETGSPDGREPHALLDCRHLFNHRVDVARDRENTCRKKDFAGGTAKVDRILSR